MQGLGDTIEAITKATGIKAATEALFGPNCGCDARKEYLNKLVPYGKGKKGGGEDILSQTEGETSGRARKD